MIKTKNIAAFPLKHSEDKFNPGMTLRDYFAGQAIIGIVSNEPLFKDLETFKDTAYFAYKIAEKLLIERQNYEPKNNG